MINTTTATKEFIAKCRAVGRVSIDDAVEIAERVGLFDSNSPRALLESAKKQRIRQILSGVYSDNEHEHRAIRSIRIGSGYIYVDLTTASIAELNLLIQEENRRIAKSKKVIKDLRRHIQGQISLDEYYAGHDQAQ